MRAAREVTTKTTTGEARRRKQKQLQQRRRRSLHNRAAFERRNRATTGVCAILPMMMMMTTMMMMMMTLSVSVLLLVLPGEAGAASHSSSNHHHHYSSSSSQHSSSSSGYHRQQQKKQQQQQQSHHHRHHRSTNSKRKKDLYEWLGVNSKEHRHSCCDDPDRLKKLYRKACLRHHPDKEGGDEDDFKQVAKAYEVLSDPHKRALYDRYGEAGLERNSGTPGGAGAMGTSGNPFTGSTSSSRSSSFFSTGGARAGPDPNAFTRFSFGGDASSSQPFHSFFQQQSSGSASASAQTASDLNFEELLQELLNGQGVGAGARRRHRPRQGPPPQHRRHDDAAAATCERPVHCTLEELYTGATKKLKVSFGNNKGGQPQKATLYKVDIQPGYKEGTKITFPAAATSGGPKMVFVVKERPHPVYRRRGNDLVYRHRLPATSDQEPPEPERIRLSIPLLDGTIWTRDIDASSSWARSGRSITIPDLGMPIRASKTTTTTTTTTTSTMPDATHGNLIIDFE
jgi:DnaJ homolog subfamily B member 4